MAMLTLAAYMPPLFVVYKVAALSVAFGTSRQTTAFLSLSNVLNGQAPQGKHYVTTYVV